MKIGELSHATGCPVQTIRYYEQRGLLPTPARSEGNYRRYDPAAAERLTFILRCRSLDMSLDEIRRLLQALDAPREDCGIANATIESHMTHVAHRLSELRALQRQLRAIRAACATPGASLHCGILNRLKRTDIESGVKNSHVPGAHGSSGRGHPPREDNGRTGDRIDPGRRGK